MTRTIILLCMLLLSVPLLIQASPVVAFVDVNVIPMDKERVVPQQTVIIRNGTIAQIGDTKRIKIPKDAQKIDGAGKYLIPGLTDMHVHLFTDDEFPAALAEGPRRIYGPDQHRFGRMRRSA